MGTQMCGASAPRKQSEMNPGFSPVAAPGLLAHRSSSFSGATTNEVARPTYSAFLLVLSAAFGRVTVPFTLTVFASALESLAAEASSTVALYAE